MSFTPTDKDFEDYDHYVPSLEDLSHYDEEDQSTSALGAFGRSAAKAPLEAIHSILKSLNLPVVSPHKAAPALYKEGDIQHPIANFLGEYAIPGGAAGKALKVGSKGLGLIKKLSDIQKYPDYKEQLIKSGEELENQEEEHQNFEKSLRRNYGTKDESSLLRKQDQARSQAEELQSLAEEKPENIANRLPGATGEGLVPQARQRTQEAAQNIQNIHNEIMPELNHEQTHDVNLQRIVNPILRANRQEISEGYNKLSADLAQHEVTIPNTSDAQQLTKQLTDLIRNGGVHSKEATKLLEELDKVGEDEAIPADVYLRSYRTAEQLAREAMNKARQVGKLTQDQRKEFEDLAERYESQAQEMSQFLEKNVDEDVLPTLEGLNSRWANEVRALDRNPFHRKLASNNPINTPNMMQALRGDARGQDFLRQTIQNNPEAVRNLVGHTYAHNPEGLLTAPPEEQQYIQLLPELQRMLQRLREAHGHHADALANEETVSRHVERLAEDNKRIKKAHDEDAAKEKTKSDARKLFADLKKKQANIERDLKTNRELRTNKENSLKKNMELDAKVKQIQKDLEAIKSVAKKVSEVIISGVVGTEIIRLFRKIF